MNKKYFSATLFFLLAFLPGFINKTTAQDTSCLSQKDYAECQKQKEAMWMKGSENIVMRKGTQLVIKLGNGKKSIFRDVLFDSAISNFDSVKNYIFLKNVKNKYIVVERVAVDGYTKILVNLANGNTRELDGFPVFSPGLTRFICVSGRFHCPYTTEQAIVYKTGDQTNKKEYKTEAKPFEAYGQARWTSETRVVLKKYDWEKLNAQNKPSETEVVLIYEFGEWRKVTK